MTNRRVSFALFVAACVLILIAPWVSPGAAEPLALNAAVLFFASLLIGAAGERGNL